jgi:hypothetical protein
MTNPATPESDFADLRMDDPKIASLVDSMFKTDIGKDRKAVLTQEQALQIARSRAFADSFIVYETLEDGSEIMKEGPLQELHLICDYLENTAVSVSGRGLKDLVQVLTARVREGDENSAIARTIGRVTS